MSVGDYIGWSEAEDDALLTAIESAPRDVTGRILWHRTSRLPGRSAHAMRDRYYHLMRQPGATRIRQFLRRSKWTAEDDARLVAAIAIYTVGRKTDWNKIATEFPSRSYDSVVSRWKKMLHDKRQTAIAVPVPTAVPVQRLCLTCREPFNSPDRRRVWMCYECKNGPRTMAAE